MKFGVCGHLEMAETAMKASYDYAEWSVPNLLKPLDPEDEFLAVLEQVRAKDLNYEAANGFVPGELKITGPDVDMDALTTYVATAMERAEKAGIDTVVFGSGGARRIPDGFDEKQAHTQLVDFCRMVGPLAQQHGVTIAIEPLNKAECNVLNTVEESAQLAIEVDHPAIRLLADAYHMMKDDDPFASIVEYASLLAHTHIATIPTRKAPGLEECDLAGFFNALKEANYTGRVSIEGGIPDPPNTLPSALAVMRSLAE